MMGDERLVEQGELGTFDVEEAHHSRKVDHLCSKFIYKTY